MAGFINVCRFNPTAGGTTDWTYSSAVTGYQSPAAAGVANNRVYKYRAESANLSQWEIGEGAYNTGTGVLARTRVLFNSSGTTSKINFSAAPQVAVVALKEDMIASDEMGLACGMTNGQLVASASAGALTVAVKTTAGNDPSATDPVFFYFRDSTLTAGDVVRIAVTAALSVVLGSTKTLGASAFPRLYISAHNDGGTVRIGAFIASDSVGIWCPQENLKYTTTVPDNTAKAFHTTTAIGTAAPWRFIGECEWLSPQTPGTWTAPDIVQLWSQALKRPGDLVDCETSATGAVASGTTTVPQDDTIPQNTEGDQYLSQAITPKSAANRLFIQSTVFGCFSKLEAVIIALFQDSTANALAAGFQLCNGANYPLFLSLESSILAGTASSTTFKIRVGGASAGTFSFNGQVGSRLFGGSFASFLRVTERKG